MPCQRTTGELVPFISPRKEVRLIAGACIISAIAAVFIIPFAGIGLYEHFSKSVFLIKIALEYTVPLVGGGGFFSGLVFFSFMLLGVKGALCCQRKRNSQTNPNSEAASPPKHKRFNPKERQIFSNALLNTESFRKEIQTELDNLEIKYVYFYALPQHVSSEREREKIFGEENSTFSLPQGKKNETICFYLYEMSEDTPSYKPIDDPNLPLAETYAAHVIIGTHNDYLALQKGQVPQSLKTKTQQLIRN